MKKYDIEVILIEEAKKNRSFSYLLHRPNLLYMWQRTQMQDINVISKIASHKLNKHLFCNEQCKSIDKYLKKMLVKNMLNPLKTYISTREHTPEITQKQLF